MKTIKWYLQGFKNPRKGFWVIFGDFLSKIIRNDRVYLSIKYWFCVGRKIHWNSPKTFNEKLNWLKIYDRNPIYTKMADKYEAKQIVANRIGSEYVVPLLGVWTNEQDIDFSSLPNQFVLKCNHNSGMGMIICKDKTALDERKVLETLKRGLKENHYWRSREWPYKNIPHKIIAEQLLDDHNGAVLCDYKWWCFNGSPKVMYQTIKTKTKSDVFENFYDMDFKPLMIEHGFPRRKPEFEKPECFETMKQLAGKLSIGIPFVRVDFFYIEGNVFFSEFTFYDWSGMNEFGGDWDEQLGNLLMLSDSRN